MTKMVDRAALKTSMALQKGYIDQGDQANATRIQQLETVSETHAEGLHKIAELAGKLNGIDSVSDELDKKADKTAVDLIESMIPTNASDSNQLADKDFVNSSISTNTGNFKGTFDSLEELHEQTAANNDYGFVVYIDDVGNIIYKRYKYVEGETWKFEYQLNNRSFTAEQWAAIKSNITEDLVDKLKSLPNASDILTPNRADERYQPVGDYAYLDDLRKLEYFADNITITILGIKAELMREFTQVDAQNLFRQIYGEL